MKIKNIIFSAIALALFLAISVFSMTGCNFTFDSLLGIEGGAPAGTQYYTVTFDSNGGSAVAEQKVASGYCANIPSDPIKSGLVFAGWYNGEDLWVFSEKAVTENVTLKAKWIVPASDKTVTFDSNGGSIVSSKVIDSTGKITEPAAPTKNGYDFLGWYLGNSAWNFATGVATESITLSAKWAIADYDITYDLGAIDAENAEENPASYTIESEIIALAAPTRPGYDFLGWTWADVTEPVKEVAIGGGETGDLSFVANWVESSGIVSYGITYELGGGVNADENPQEYTVGEEIITLAAPTRAHYEFLGWTYEGVTVPQLSVTIDPTFDEGDKTYTANWRAKTYTVRYVLYGGEHIGNTTSYTVEDLPISLNPASKESVHFLGWYTDEEYSVVMTDIITPVEDLVLYAKFIDGTQGIKYEMNADSDAYIVTGYEGTERQLYIAYYYNGLPVVAIAENAFKNNSLSDIVIPEGVTEIGAGAFNGCESLTKISIPSTLTYVGSGAFNGCTSINGSYMLEDGVYYLGNDVNPYTIVMSSLNVTSGIITVKPGAKIIHTDAFANSPAVKEINLPDGITEICDNAFSGLTKLEKLSIPSSIKFIGEFAFHACTELAYTVEGGVKYLGNEDNKYLVIVSVDAGLTELTVKTSTKIVCAYAFSKYTSLSVTYEAGSQTGMYIHPTGNNVLFTEA